MAGANGGTHLNVRIFHRTSLSFCSSLPLFHTVRGPWLASASPSYPLLSISVDPSHRGRLRVCRTLQSQTQVAGSDAQANSSAAKGGTYSPCRSKLVSASKRLEVGGSPELRSRHVKDFQAAPRIATTTTAAPISRLVGLVTAKITGSSFNSPRDARSQMRLNQRIISGVTSHSRAGCR
jgi:hypothetical protein